MATANFAATVGMAGSPNVARTIVTQSLILPVSDLPFEWTRMSVSGKFRWSDSDLHTVLSASGGPVGSAVLEASNRFGGTKVSESTDFCGIRGGSWSGAFAVTSEIGRSIHPAVSSNAIPSAEFASPPLFVKSDIFTESATFSFSRPCPDSPIIFASVTISRTAILARSVTRPQSSQLSCSSGIEGSGWFGLSGLVLSRAGFDATFENVKSGSLEKSNIRPWISIVDSNDHSESSPVALSAAIRQSEILDRSQMAAVTSRLSASARFGGSTGFEWSSSVLFTAGFDRSIGFANSEALAASKGIGSSNHTVSGQIVVTEHEIESEKFESSSDLGISTPLARSLDVIGPRITLSPGLRCHGLPRLNHWH
jgi:hypothetical protein